MDEPVEPSEFEPEAHEAPGADNLESLELELRGEEITRYIPSSVICSKSPDSAS